MDPFKKTIQEYLDNRAQTDSLFASNLAKENKNIEDCINYIYSEVQKSGRKGFTDDEIFGMAVHYYDEDDLKVVSSASKPRVVVNHVVELSEEEKDILKQQAADEYKNEVKAKLEKQFEKPAAKKDKISKAQDAPSLNLFGDEDE